MTIENFETVFFARQKVLFTVLERSQNLTAKYEELLTPQWEKNYSWDFNLLYDLEQRIINRIEALQSEYFDLHWDKYQFNSY